MHHAKTDVWEFSHERYRPFVLYHRTQASALAYLPDEEGAIDDTADPEKAIEQISTGLEQMRDLFVEHEAEEQFEQDELVLRLNEFRESIRESYSVGVTLQERIDKAIEDENYEEAARLRDELDQRDASL